MHNLETYLTKKNRSIFDTYSTGMSINERIKNIIDVYPKYSIKRYLIFIFNLLCNLNPPLFNNKYKDLSKDILFILNFDTKGKYLFLFHKFSTKGKIYIYQFNNSGNLETFTKFNTNSLFHKKLENEKNVIGRLKKKDLNFDIPEVIKFSIEKHFSFITYKALRKPQNLLDKSIPYPLEIIDSIKSLKISKNKEFFFDLKTLIEIKKRINNDKLKRFIEQIDFYRTLNSYPAHCDLGSENTFFDTSSKKKKYTVIDWEDFSEVAPLGVDEVGVWLGRNHKIIKSIFFKFRKKSLLNNFFIFFSKSKIGLEASIISLLFLVKKENDLAEMICN